MNLLELAANDGLQPKRVASTHGGEYHSPCPGCGGRDRFIIWDKRDRYRCRQCQKRGDLIQYLRDFHSLSYTEACARLGVEPKEKRSFFFRPKPVSIFQPSVINSPPPQWSAKAELFVGYCHARLMRTPYALDLFHARGFTHETLKRFKLGWNPQTVWLKRSYWGLPENEQKKLWLPMGLVIPTFSADDVVKLKIRRTDWHEKDDRPKYVEISGSMQAPGIYGYAPHKPIMVLESELDALLIQQFAGDLCCCMALGGASKRPDAHMHKLLLEAPLILFTFDVDQAGAIAYRWWKNTYHHLKIWVPPVSKSPGDAYRQGVDLKKWIEIGIEGEKA